MTRWKNAPWYNDVLVAPLRVGMIPALNGVAAADGEVSTAERSQIDGVADFLLQ